MWANTDVRTGTHVCSDEGHSGGTELHRLDGIPAWKGLIKIRLISGELSNSIESWEMKPKLDKKTSGLAYPHTSLPVVVSKLLTPS
jgi:hypothetical protein